MYSPPLLARPDAVTITPWSYQSIADAAYTTGQFLPTANNYVAANVGVFVPFTIPEPVLFTKLFWGNGTAVTGNLDVGLFGEDGTLLVAAGTTAQAGTSTLQVVDVTDTLLARGRYYFGLTSDTSAVGQKVLAAVPAAGIAQALGCLEDAACAPPFSTNANPATFAAYTRAFIPLVGAQGFRTVGP